MMLMMTMMKRENAETVQMVSRISIHSQLGPNLRHDDDEDFDEEYDNNDDDDNDDDDNGDDDDDPVII